MEVPTSTRGASHLSCGYLRQCPGQGYRHDPGRWLPGYSRASSHMRLGLKGLRSDLFRTHGLFHRGWHGEVGRECHRCHMLSRSKGHAMTAYTLLVPTLSWEVDTAVEAGDSRRDDWVAMRWPRLPEFCPKESLLRFVYLLVLCLLWAYN